MLQLNHRRRLSNCKNKTLQMYKVLTLGISHPTLDAAAVSAAAAVVALFLRNNGCTHKRMLAVTFMLHCVHCVCIAKCAFDCTRKETLFYSIEGTID